MLHPWAFPVLEYERVGKLVIVCSGFENEANDMCPLDKVESDMICLGCEYLNDEI